MKVPYVVTLLVLATAAYADNIQSAYGYLTKYGIPQAEKLRAAEERFAKSQEGRIVGGVPAALGQYPYQAGLLIDLVGINNQAVCGAVLVSDQRLLTAAHCWSDGQNQAWRHTVILGSVTLFNGGTRIQTSVVITHSAWFPLLARNDIAVIYLSNAVTTTNGSITTGQFLSHVSLQVISNTVCSFSFPLIIQSSHICTSGIGGGSTCRGDSGGPLVVVRDNGAVLVS